MEELRIILSTISGVCAIASIGALVVFAKKTSDRLEELENRVKELERKNRCSTA